MAPFNKATTLRDLNNNYECGGSAGDGDGIPSTSVDGGDIPAQGGTSRSGEPGLHGIFHIPTLPQADQSRQMLERVVSEFRPIAKRRGYMVLSVSELCCCNDGLDFRNDGQRSKRKLNKVGNNIWGYNRTIWRHGRHGPKVHTIHLRLRHAQNHNRFLAYEDVAGTLAHELSHCEYGPHNEMFFKLMDSILDEHASLMASHHTPGATVPSNFIPFGGEGHKLGGSGDNNNGGGKPLGRGYTLGGDASFTQWMSPREAAVAAALARQRQQQLRLRGNRCCRPCVITGDGEDDEQDKVEIIDVDAVATSGKAETAKEGISGLTNERKRPTVVSAESENQKPSKRSQPKEDDDVIDLTGDDSVKPPPVAATASKKWACRSCTFLNSSPFLPACEMCLTPRN